MNSNTSQYKKFCRDGYIIASEVLNHAEVADIREALALPFKNICSHLGLPIPSGDNNDSLHKSMVALKNHDQITYLNTIKISQNSHHILGIPAKSGIQSALHQAGLEQPVVSLKPFPVMISDQLHIDGGYNLRPLHQEWPVMQGSSDAVVCWIALQDITENHNALHLVPGSHSEGMREYERTKCGTGIATSQLPKSKPKRIEIKKGDAVIFSCFLAHGTSPEGGDLRAAVTIRFNNLAANDFIARGYPDPSKVEINRQPENMYSPKSIIRAT